MGYSARRGFTNGKISGAARQAELQQKIAAMQEKMTEAQDAVEAQEFTASVGGGVVEAKVNGKKEVLSGPAMELYNELSKEFMVDYDGTGSIGKRYRRQDEIGTPFCITLDFETVGDENTPADHCVTIRERDTMNQVRIPIDQVKSYLEEKIKF